MERRMLARGAGGRQGPEDYFRKAAGKLLISAAMGIGACGGNNAHDAGPDTSTDGHPDSMDGDARTKLCEDERAFEVRLGLLDSAIFPNEYRMTLEAAEGESATFGVLDPEGAELRDILMYEGAENIIAFPGRPVTAAVCDVGEDSAELRSDTGMDVELAPCENVPFTENSVIETGIGTQELSATYTECHGERTWQSEVSVFSPSIPYLAEEYGYYSPGRCTVRIADEEYLLLDFKTETIDIGKESAGGRLRVSESIPCGEGCSLTVVSIREVDGALSATMRISSAAGSYDIEARAGQTVEPSGGTASPVHVHSLDAGSADISVISSLTRIVVGLPFSGWGRTLRFGMSWQGDFQALAGWSLEAW